MLPFDTQECHERLICLRFHRILKMILEMAFSAHCTQIWKLSRIYMTNFSKVARKCIWCCHRAQRCMTTPYSGENCAVGLESVVKISTFSLCGRMGYPARPFYPQPSRLTSPTELYLMRPPFEPNESKTNSYTNYLITTFSPAIVYANSLKLSKHRYTCRYAKGRVCTWRVLTQVFHKTSKHTLICAMDAHGYCYYAFAKSILELWTLQLFKSFYVNSNIWIHMD